MREFRERYGPVALVTGASSGIGLSFAAALAARGLDLVLVARRVERLQALREQFGREYGVTVTVHAADLARADAADAIMAATSGMDIGLVVSNAGFSLPGDHAGHDGQAITDLLMVNCHAPLMLTHGFIPRLRARGKGGIVLTGSVEGLIGSPYSAAYSASKALVKSLGEALWGELTPDGIDVLTILPGATDTEALARHGRSAATTPNVTAPEVVVELALDGLKDGPTLITSEHYKTMFDRLLAMPRRDALVAMANALRPA